MRRGLCLLNDLLQQGCLRGELSDLLSVATVTRMMRHHAGMQSIEIPNRGHTPTLDEPESRTALDSFLKSL